MKILFIVNPVSGPTSNDEAILLIHKTAAERKADFKFFYTSSDHVDDLILAELKEYKPDRVIACGGDGTVQVVGKNLMNRKIPMGILPLGSANGLATALGIPEKLEEAVNLAFNGSKTIDLDIVKFNDKQICTHLADLGINAKMIKNYEEKGEKGMLGYAKFLFQSIKDSPLLSYTIKTPEKEYTKEGYMIVIGNAHMYGTGIWISEGSVSDGRFEICNVPKIALDEAIKAGLTRFNVFLDKNMFADVITCANAEIKIDQKVDFQVDGEYMGEVDHLKISIVPAAIPVLIG
ncbi:MAG TPA: diacylglycerol kinase family protein [Chryseolinea sp.]